MEHPNLNPKMQVVELRLVSCFIDIIPNKTHLHKWMKLPERGFNVDFYTGQSIQC